MTLPEPLPGLVIRYANLWRSEEVRGREEATKDRPCAVVLALRRHQDKLTVVVAPITHPSPRTGSSALEIPAKVKTRLRLDDRRSWIVTDEVNTFTWPGPDLRPAHPNDSMPDIAFGYLPARLIQEMLDSIRVSRARVVNRDFSTPDKRP